MKGRQKKKIYITIKGPVMKLIVDFSTEVVKIRGEWNNNL